MNIELVIPDTHIRSLHNGALVNRLVADVVRGLRNHHNTGIVAGYRIQLAQADPAEDDELAYALEHRKPGAARVDRHDCWTEVTLMPGYKVSLYRREWFA